MVVKLGFNQSWSKTCWRIWSLVLA